MIGTKINVLLVDLIVTIVMHGWVKHIVHFVLLITIYHKMVSIAYLNQVLINAEVAKLVYGKVIKFAKNVNLITNKVIGDLVNLYVQIIVNTVAMILLLILLKTFVIRPILDTIWIGTINKLSN